MAKTSYLEKLIKEFPDYKEEILEYWEIEGNNGDWNEFGEWIKYSQKTKYIKIKKHIMDTIK